MKQTIKQRVDRWVEEESQQRTLALKIIRKNDPWQGMTDEEIEDRREFIRCHMAKDFETFLVIPVQPRESDFWFSSHQEFLESAFNTYDFQKSQRPFDKYGYRIKKVLEQVKDLAILHSCISQPEGKGNILRRFQSLVENEFREKLIGLVERHKKARDEEYRMDIRQKIAGLNRRILKCQKTWEQYAHWE